MAYPTQAAGEQMAKLLDGARIDEAKTEYEHLRDTAAERKAAIQAKIDALKA